MEEMNQTVAEGAVTKKDLRRLFLRSWTIMCSWNYERQMHMGFMFGMAPILDKLYKNKPEKCREAYQRHMEPESISMIKTSLMGPFAGIGDSFFQGTLRIITFGIGLSFAQQGNVLGPILAVLLFAIPSIIMGYYGTVLGYQSGNKYLTKLYQEGIMERVMQCASIVGLAVVGGMVASMVSITTPLAFHAGGTELVLQDMLDTMFPKLLPLLATLGIYRLIQKKVNTNLLLLGIVICGIVLGALGIL